MGWSGIVLISLLFIPHRAEWKIRLNIIVWGPPASGKSTLCAGLEALLRARFPSARVVPLSFDAECLGGRQDLPCFGPERFAELQGAFLASVQAAQADFCVVEDVLATPQARRRIARIPGTTVFVHLHCPREVCETRNALRPAQERVPAGYLERYFSELEAMPGRAGPADSSLEVFQTEARDPAAVLEEVLRKARENVKTPKNEKQQLPSFTDDLEHRSRELVRAVAGTNTHLFAPLNTVRKQFLAERRREAVSESAV